MSDDNGLWVDGNGNGNGADPRLLAAIPCEDGTVSFAMNDSRVTLQRLFYEVYAAEFPAAFERLNVATIWMGGEGEHTVGVRFSDPDGAVLSEVVIDYDPRPEPASAIHLFHFSNARGDFVLTLPRAGKYAVDVLLDDVPVFSFPFFAVALPPARQPELEIVAAHEGDDETDEDEDETDEEEEEEGTDDGTG